MTFHLPLRHLSILLLTAVIVVLMFGHVQSAPVWLLVVPFGLLAAEELRGRRGEETGGESVGQGARRMKMALPGVLVFHGVVITTVIAAHWEMGHRDDPGAAATSGRYVSTKAPASGGCGTGGMCGGSSASAKGGCSGGCGSGGGGGGCGSGCGGGGVTTAKAAPASKPVTLSTSSIPLNIGRPPSVAGTPVSSVPMLQPLRPGLVPPAPVIKPGGAALAPPSAVLPTQPNVSSIPNRNDAAGGAAKPAAPTAAPASAPAPSAP